MTCDHDVDIAKLRRNVQSLLDQLADRFPQGQLDLCRSLTRAGEWAEAVDIMCAVLFKNEITVTRQERQALAEMLDMR